MIFVEFNIFFCEHNLFVITFMLLTLSPINIWSYGNIYVDQGVFETVAMMIKRGYMPYRDTFDHKGPFLSSVVKEIFKKRKL